MGFLNIEVPVIKNIYSGGDILDSNNISHYEEAPINLFIDYIYVVPDNSMSGYDFLKGDKLYIKETNSLNTGDIGLFLYKYDILIAIYGKGCDTTLLSRNGNNIVIDNFSNNNFKILGKVISNKRFFKEK